MSKLSSLRDFFKGIKLKDLTAPGIIFFLFIIVVSIFFLSTRYISGKANEIFGAEARIETATLDIARYNATLKKLRLAPATDSPKIPGAPRATTTTATSTTETVGKDSLSISILNSSSKSGVAGALAKTLEQAGYSTPSTGNEKSPFPTTTVFIKESKKTFADELLGVVRKTYPAAFSTTTPETASSDITIIISGH